MTKKIPRTIEEKKKIHAERMRNWRRKSPQKAAAIMKRFRNNHPKTPEQKANDAVYQRLWHKGHKKQAQAIYYANYYLKPGSLAALLSGAVLDVCELCPEDDKRTENLEKHHPDYDYPLIVVTVCKECHELVERDIQRTKNEVLECQI